MNTTSKRGENVGIYVLGPANKFCDGVVSGRGETAMCASVGEDYAKNCMWPVVVKTKAGVSREQLISHLRDLANAIEKGFFVHVLNQLPKDPLGTGELRTGWFCTPDNDSDVF